MRIIKIVFWRIVFIMINLMRVWIQAGPHSSTRLIVLGGNLWQIIKFNSKIKNKRIYLPMISGK